jgi:type VI protein secretion system component Hcp
MPPELFSAELKTRETHMSFNTDIYIAFQIQEKSTGDSKPAAPAPDISGWIKSGFNYQQTDVALGPAPDPNSTATQQSNLNASLPIYSTHFPHAPLVTQAYSRARTCEMQVKRDYAGINSSGGPQVAGRADHSDVIITRDCDLISPYLFQYCSSGWQIKSVYIIRYIGSETISFNFCHEWVLTGVQVTDYQFTNGRYFNECLNELTLFARETVSLLYTSAKYRCSQFTGGQTIDKELGEFKGWNTGDNTGIGMPP